MRIISRTGICKEPSSGIHLDVLGPVNFDNTTNLKNTLFLDSASTIEALATSAVANKIRIGVLASTTAIDIGVAAHAKSITIGGPNDTVLIQGTVVTNNATNLNVLDKIITLNKGGAAASASESGVEFEENNVITAYFRTNSARNAYEMKAPALAGRIALQPGSGNFIHTIISIASANRSWTLPDTTDTFAGIASAQTLTNKTITSAILNGSTTISGTALTVSSSSTTFSQPITMSNTVTMTGSTLTVSNATTFTGNTTLSGAVTLNNNILPNANNSRSIGSAGLRLANVFTTLLNVSGAATFASDLSVTGNLSVSGTSIFTGTVRPVASATDLGTNAQRWLTTYTQSLNASGASTLTGAVTMGNNATVAGTLGVTGNTSVSTLSSSGLSTLNSLSVTTTSSFTGSSTFNGAVDTNAAHRGGYGLVPVGFIGAYNPGYFTNGTNAGFTVVGPAGNNIAAINTFLNAKGWYVCNGAAVNNVNSPIWNAADRFLPNLSGDRFLMGATAAGTVGGANSISLTASNIPTLSVSVEVTGTISGTAAQRTFTSASAGSHTHAITVNNFNGNTSVNGHHTHDIRAEYSAPFDQAALAHGALGGPAPYSAGAGDHSHSMSHGHSASSDSAGSHTHSIVIPNTVPISGTGTGAYTNSSVSSFNNRPQYLSTFYIIRVF